MGWGVKFLGELNNPRVETSSRGQLNRPLVGSFRSGRMTARALSSLARACATHRLASACPVHNCTPGPGAGLQGHSSANSRAGHQQSRRPPDARDSLAPPPRSGASVTHARWYATAVVLRSSWGTHSGDTYGVMVVLHASPQQRTTQGRREMIDRDREREPGGRHVNSTGGPRATPRRLTMASACSSGHQPRTPSPAQACVRTLGSRRVPGSGGRPDQEPSGRAGQEARREGKGPAYIYVQMHGPCM
jgi:hypothetical protein